MPGKPPSHISSHDGFLSQPNREREALLSNTERQKQYTVAWLLIADTD